MANRNDRPLQQIQRRYTTKQVQKQTEQPVTRKKVPGFKDLRHRFCILKFSTSLFGIRPNLLHP